MGKRSYNNGYGEKLEGVVNEEYGHHLDRVNERAGLYVLSKIGQEVIARYYSEMCDKIYGIISLGTALGEGMPKNGCKHLYRKRVDRRITNSIQA